MGGRGAYWSGASKDYISREFDTIDTVNDGTIKVLKKRDGVIHLHFPLYSNTPNTTYFVVDEKDNGKLAFVGFYRNHSLVESIDLNDKRGLHWHAWSKSTHKDGKETLVKLDKDNFDLKPRHLRMLKYKYYWEK